MINGSEPSDLATLLFRINNILRNFVAGRAATEEAKLLVGALDRLEEAVRRKDSQPMAIKDV